MLAATEEYNRMITLPFLVELLFIYNFNCFVSLKKYSWRSCNAWTLGGRCYDELLFWSQIMEEVNILLVDVEFFAWSLPKEKKILRHCFKVTAIWLEPTTA